MATATGVFFLSLTAIPISYSLNLFKSDLNERWTLFVAGSLVLGAISLITYLMVRFTQKSSKPKDISFYGKLKPHSYGLPRSSLGLADGKCSSM